MAELVTPQSIVLTPGNRLLRSPRVPLSPLTSQLTLMLRRPTTTDPLAWGDAEILRVSLVCIVDEVEYRCDGRASGGVRVNHLGNEQGFYKLTYNVPVLFGDKARNYLSTAQPDTDGFYHNVPLTRIGELGRTVEGYIELERVSGGSINTVLSITESVDAPAPTIRHKNSVAFDAATGANEAAGDGVLSVSHTAGGSDRAAFLGCGNAAGTPPLGSATYGGTAMTEQWDAVFQTNYAHAGYTFVAPPASAQTVTHTLAAAPSEHAMGVVTFTGVDQTTPVGTPVTGSGQFTTITVTVGSVGADDMVVDSVWGDNPFGAIGADQTERNSQLPGSLLKQSTQPGTAGGEMSWGTASSNWGSGAIRFIAVTGPPPVTPSLWTVYTPLRW